MEITGQITAIMPLKQGVSQRTGNEWMLQEYVIQTQEQYPKNIMFEVLGQNKIQAFNIQMGEVITVCFDISARENKGRWFNQVNCFSIKRNGVVVQVPQQQPMQQGYQQQPNYPPTANVHGQPMQQGYQQPYVPQTQDKDLPF